MANSQARQLTCNRTDNAKKGLYPWAISQSRCGKQVSTQACRPTCTLARLGNVIDDVHHGLLPAIRQNGSFGNQRFRKRVAALVAPHKGRPAEDKWSVTVSDAVNLVRKMVFLFQSMSMHGEWNSNEINNKSAQVESGQVASLSEKETYGQQLFLQPVAPFLLGDVGKQCSQQT